MSGSSSNSSEIKIKLNEEANINHSLPWDKLASNLKYNEQGLIPAIAQQFDTKEVLMMAWMNLAAIEESLSSGYACYWSRSRQQLWRKGETSGQRQKLLKMEIDCDGDTLLLSVDQQGPACHTGRRSCFYNEIDQQNNRVFVTSAPLIDPKELYGNSEDQPKQDHEK